ncbi:MAG: hypothetical protein H7A24_08420 [Leptospiraceae bacterium]|nr:hypothetical protein [Leptospiraceae bacterium]MCP5511892.1 hypothetical protein [Leptospiraceae bacterium]
MSQSIDIKPILIWAKQNGDTAIIERILVKLLPQLMKEGIRLTAKEAELAGSIPVSQNMYSDVKQVAETFVGQSFPE